MSDKALVKFAWEQLAIIKSPETGTIREPGDFEVQVLDVVKLVHELRNRVADEFVRAETAARGCASLQLAVQDAVQLLEEYLETHGRSYSTGATQSVLAELQRALNGACGTNYSSGIK